MTSTPSALEESVRIVQPAMSLTEYQWHLIHAITGSSCFWCEIDNQSFAALRRVCRQFRNLADSKIEAMSVVVNQSTVMASRCQDGAEVLAGRDDTALQKSMPYSSAYNLLSRLVGMRRLQLTWRCSAVVKVNTPAGHSIPLSRSCSGSCSTPILSVHGLKHTYTTGEPARSMQQTPVDQCLAMSGCLPHLHSITLCSTELSASSLALLASCSRLRALDLQAARTLTLRGLQDLSHLTHLTHLGLGVQLLRQTEPNNATTAATAATATPATSSSSTNTSTISAQCLSSLCASLTNLRSLVLDSPDLLAAAGDQGLLPLTALSGLTALALFPTCHASNHHSKISDVTGQVCQLLASLPLLCNLDLGSAALLDWQILQTLAKLPHLTRLHCCSAANLNQLLNGAFPARLPHLHHLGIACSSIHHEGAAQPHNSSAAAAATTFVHTADSAEEAARARSSWCSHSLLLKDLELLLEACPGLVQLQLGCQLLINPALPGMDPGALRDVCCRMAALAAAQTCSSTSMGCADQQPSGSSPFTIPARLSSAKTSIPRGYCVWSSKSSGSSPCPASPPLAPLSIYFVNQQYGLLPWLLALQPLQAAHLRQLTLRAAWLQAADALALDQAVPGLECLGIECCYLHAGVWEVLTAGGGEVLKGLKRLQLVGCRGAGQQLVQDLQEARPGLEVTLVDDGDIE